MRSICKKGSATVVVVLALCALASASASASQFYVGGKALSGTAALASTVKVEQPIVFTIERSKTVKPTITCTKAGFENQKAALESPGKMSFETIYLQGCSLSGLNGCTMESGISFWPFEGALTTGTAPEDSALFNPKNTKRILSEFGFTGGTCELNGEGKAFVGKLPLKLAKGQAESVEQEFVGEGASGVGLEFVGWSPGTPVSVTGKLKLKLASGQAWSYR